MDSKCDNIAEAIRQAVQMEIEEEVRKALEEIKNRKPEIVSRVLSSFQISHGFDASLMAHHFTITSRDVTMRFAGEKKNV